MATLSAEAVDIVMKSVLYKDDEITPGEIPDEAIIVRGLVRSFGFHPGRVTGAKASIDAMLAELPDSFWLTRGGGMTFLNGCMDRHDLQWGEQRNVEALVCLGIAAGSASWIMRDMASALPGGVPYFEIHPETTSTSIAA